MIHWNADPILLEIGPLMLRWYGLLFAGGFYVGYLLAARSYIRAGLPHLAVDRLLLYMIVGTIIGARLGHTLFYEPGYYLSNPLRILKVWEGGLASHGAALGNLIAITIYSRRFQLRFLWVLDTIAAPAAIAGCFIRLGNLFNSEIIGKPADVPWAFVFQRVDMIPRHPAQLYEALAYLIIFFVLLRLQKRASVRSRHGVLFGLALVLIFGFRFFVEFAKAPQVAFEQTLILNLGQALSIPLVIGGAALIWYARQRPQKSPRS